MIELNALMQPQNEVKKLTLITVIPCPSLWFLIEKIVRDLCSV